MNLNELKEKIDKAIKEGYGEAEVLIDVEARKYNYHMARIDGVWIIPEEALVEKLVSITLEQDVTLTLDRDAAEN